MAVLGPLWGSWGLFGASGGVLAAEFRGLLTFSLGFAWVSFGFAWFWLGFGLVLAWFLACFSLNFFGFSGFSPSSFSSSWFPIDFLCFLLFSFGFL